jgi:hypothetical protein
MNLSLNEQVLRLSNSLQMDVVIHTASDEVVAQLHTSKPCRMKATTFIQRAQKTLADRTNAKTLFQDKLLADPPTTDKLQTRIRRAKSIHHRIGGDLTFAPDGKTVSARWGKPGYTKLSLDQYIAYGESILAKRTAQEQLHETEQERRFKVAAD